MDAGFLSKHTNLPWLAAGTILLVRHGSHAYGTSVPTSDEDFKGVAIPPRPYFLGFHQVFEQAESKEPDAVVYELRKFFRLAADCNPAILEALFVDPSDRVVVTALGERLLAHRERFLSKRARFTFSGFATAQFKRIQVHRKWLVDPPAAPPARADFGLPDKPPVPEEQLATVRAQVEKHVNLWFDDFGPGVDEPTKQQIREKMSEYLTEMNIGQDARWTAAARALGLEENFIQYLKKEREHAAALHDYKQYLAWKAARNPQRAELEAKYGYDTKFGLHVVRLYRMCREILEEGRVLVRRPDAEELLAIRRGAWSYEQLAAFAEAQDRALEDLYRRSTLPKAPDRAALDALCIELAEASFKA